jgi:hypothetical protein
MLRDTDTEACIPVRTEVLQQNVLAKSLDKQFEITNTTSLLNLTKQWRWQL